MSEGGGLIWLASFPKSGNTWFRIFLANLAAGERAPVDINDLDELGAIASNRGQFEAATLLDSGLLWPDDIERLRPRVYEHIAAAAAEPRWLKVHDAYTLTPDGEPLFGRAARAAIYLVRDPRDVAVSLSFHNNASLDDTIQMMNNPDSALCRNRKGIALQLVQKLGGWSGHVASWLEQTDLPVLALRYEDLIADPVASFTAALAFAGMAAAPEDIGRAARHADFAELQRQERERGFIERVSADAAFFRSGRAGAWRDTLCAEQAARIEEAHGETMRRFGYELSAPCGAADAPGDTALAPPV
jgi:hypothetical protein